MQHEQIAPLPLEQRAALNLESLRQNPYPGRGIVMGLDETGSSLVQVYFLMGRSDNSRNRRLVPDGASTFRTDFFDSTKGGDPSLVIYNALREVNGIQVVTNGDQTDTFVKELQEVPFLKNLDGEALERQQKAQRAALVKAALQRSYEPDRPNYTPRISGLYVPDTDQPFIFTINSRNPQPPHVPNVDIYSFPEPQPGYGRIIHTYTGDGDPLPSFTKPPYEVPLKGSIDDIGNQYWDVLNGDNKVAMVVRMVDRATQEIQTRRIDRHAQVWE